MRSKNSKTARKSKPAPKPPAPPKPPAIDQAQLAQVFTWIAQGQTEHAIAEAIAAQWPDAQARPLIVAALAVFTAAALLYNPPAEIVLPVCSSFKLMICAVVDPGLLYTSMSELIPTLLDVTAAYRISEWISSPSADGHWKGNHSGDLADFTKFLEQNYKDVDAVMKGLGLAKK